MADEELTASSCDDAAIAVIRAELEAASPTRRQMIWEAVASAALGSIPWVGGVMAAGLAYRQDVSSANQDSLRDRWLDQHQRKLEELRRTLEAMLHRLESLGPEIEDRMESQEYLQLVRKTFRIWDEADTAEKRGLLVSLITNAAGKRIVSDDILRLFLNWIDAFHEAHFAVIREIYRNPSSTRYDIWVAIYGEAIPRDDSADADVFKMLVSDLNIGRVIRLRRDSDPQGRWQRKAPSRRAPRQTTLESAFEDTKPWVLTELGGQFVSYAMTELVQRLNAQSHVDGTQ